ncbi:VIT domain-containing protein [Sphingobium subterraneum]|uniref:VIT domain-containing protein n=1 Tax=Sphingobium subterraneum TaxID=627688 RepID=A0A841J8M2_9SPHN|nr:VIT domain-containing protein [Sphingobium subterraneum]MBB6124898.1 hypothetical protein [Sphingobium subterraneum]
MNASTLLVDPLAALFRTELTGLPPLLLETTHVEVMPLPPLAHIVVIRTFTNSTDQMVEAVLTLPPIAPQEVVYRLIVAIGGVEYHASAQPGKHARRAHDAAVAEGRRAILYELLVGGIQLISIAGIEPGAKVDVQIWSIRPLDRPEENRASLTIPLSAKRQAAIFSLSDVDALVTTAERHSASVSVSADFPSLLVRITGQPFGDRHLISKEEIGVECSRPICLHFAAINGGTLDHREWHVDHPGGWEVTSERGIETFRHPRNPNGTIISDRDDWVFGSMQTPAGEICVTAPLPSEGAHPNAGGLLEIAPNARALRAFAAAGFVESATPKTAADVLLVANVLSRQTSLAFIGPEGELSSHIPTLRKVALSEMESIDFAPEPEEPIEPPPVEYEVPPKPEPVLPEKGGDPISPGARPPRYRWLTWVPLGLALLLVVAAFQTTDAPVLPLFAAFIGLIIVSALRFLPREGSPARRRLPLLILLLLPWIVSIVAEPLLGYLPHEEPPGHADWWIPFQYGLLAVSAILPLVLMPVMRDARRFTLTLGFLNLALTFFAVLANIIIHTPGS